MGGIERARARERERERKRKRQRQKEKRREGRETCRAAAPLSAEKGPACSSNCRPESHREGQRGRERDRD